MLRRGPIRSRCWTQSGEALCSDPWMSSVKWAAHFRALVHQTPVGDASQGPDVIGSTSRPAPVPWRRGRPAQHSGAIAELADRLAVADRQRIVDQHIGRERARAAASRSVGQGGPNARTGDLHSRWRPRTCCQRAGCETCSRSPARANVPGIRALKARSSAKPLASGRLVRAALVRGRGSRERMRRGRGCLACLANRAREDG